jgi:hypothetical protein
LYSGFDACLRHLALAEQLDTGVRNGLSESVDKVRNEVLAPHEEDTPQIRACKVESHAAERAGLHSDSLGNFYEVALHVSATLARSASTTSDQIR